jgi:hypothetical protein
MMSEFFPTYLLKWKFLNKYLFQFELINHFDRNFITTYSVVKKDL